MTDIKKLFEDNTKQLTTTPGIASAQADLEIANITQRIKGNLNGLIGNGELLNGETEKFRIPAVVQKSIEIQQKYNFQPLGNQTDFSYLSRVISIKDFQENPNLYFSKLTKGFGSFPLDFDLNQLSENFLNDFGIDFNFREGIIYFQHRPLVQYQGQTQDNLSYSLNKALIDSGVGRFHTEGYIVIDMLSFLKNYDNFINFINGEIENEEQRKYIFSCFKTIKTVVLSIFKTVTNISIESPKHFFENEKSSFSEIREKGLQKNFNQEEHNPFNPQSLSEQEVFLDIENMLLHTAKGVSKSDIDELIKIQNTEQFIILVDLLLKKILEDKSVKKTWINNIQKDISEYKIEELIALATFLARYLIEEYEKIEDMVDRVLLGFSSNALSGKCTDYTGMSLHIVNYFKLKYPEKFKNIIAGYDNQNIGDGYKHCYMKIYGYNSDGGIEVTFIDPTKLSSVSIQDLQITKDIYDTIDASNLPIQIDRNAEDIIITKLRQKNNTKGEEQIGEIISSNKPVIENSQNQGTIINLFSYTKQKVLKFVGKK